MNTCRSLGCRRQLVNWDWDWKSIFHCFFIWSYFLISCIINGTDKYADILTTVKKSFTNLNLQYYYCKCTLQLEWYSFFEYLKIIYWNVWYWSVNNLFFFYKINTMLIRVRYQNMFLVYRSNFNSFSRSINHSVLKSFSRLFFVRGWQINLILFAS